MNGTKSSGKDVTPDARWSDYNLGYGPGLAGLADLPIETERSPLSYFRSVLDRKWTVLLVFVVATGLAAVYAYTAAPWFVSRATIQINKVYPSSANLNDLFAFFGQFDLFYQTQLESLRSVDLAHEFLKRQEELQSKGQAPPVPTGTDTVEKPDRQAKSATDGKTRSDNLDVEEEKRKAAEVNSLLSRVRITPVRGTQMIEVEMGANDALQAKQMLQLYLAAYIDESRRKQDELGGRMRVWLKRELEESKKQLDRSESELLDFTKEHGIVLMDQKPHEMITQFDRAGDELIKSKSERFNIEALGYDKEKVLPPSVSSEYLQSLKSKLAGLKSEYTGNLATWDPSYFKMAVMRSKIESLEKAISEIERSTLTSALDTARKRESMSQESYEKTKQDAINMNSLMVQYSILKKAVEANEQLYLMLLQKSKQAELDRGIMGHEVVVSSAPTMPLAPVRPQKSKIVAIGALIGLLGGVVIALCLEFVDSTVQTTQEIQEQLKLPILGAVPLLTQSNGLIADTSQGGALEFAAHRFPASPFTDAVRIVQNAAASMMPSDSAYTLAVSSALPLEGKTMMSVLIGTVIASDRKRVLVVDGDLRSPRIHRVFRCKDEDVGLSDLLSGKSVRLKEAIRQSHIAGMYYMTAGFRSDNPVTLLKSPRFLDILEACKKVFDVIILDAPPVLGLVDARVISTYAEGLILVTRAGHTPIELLREAKDVLQQQGQQGRLLGIVLNMADYRKAYGYHSYNSKYYRRYYHRSDEINDSILIPESAGPDEGSSPTGETGKGGGTAPQA